jgi:hypothetical protein
MAAATVTSNSYGFRVTGGTDATTVTTYKARVGIFHFVAAGAADTCTITDKDGNAVIIISSLGAAGDITSVDFYDAPIDGLIVTLSDAAGVLVAIIC